MRIVACPRRVRAAAAIASVQEGPQRRLGPAKGGLSTRLNKIVHRGCAHEHNIARTRRGWLKNIVSYSMFYHLEHHLFPAVPTCHLPHLARRLDEVAPEYREKQVM